MEIEGYYIKKGNDLLAALYDAGLSGMISASYH